MRSALSLATSSRKHGPLVASTGGIGSEERERRREEERGETSAENNKQRKNKRGAGSDECFQLTAVQRGRERTRSLGEYI